MKDELEWKIVLGVLLALYYNNSVTFKQWIVELLSVCVSRISCVVEEYVTFRINILCWHKLYRYFFLFYFAQGFQDIFMKTSIIYYVCQKHILLSIIFQVNFCYLVFIVFGLKLGLLGTLLSYTCSCRNIICIQFYESNTMIWSRVG